MELVNAVQKQVKSMCKIGQEYVQEQTELVKSVCRCGWDGSRVRSPTSGIAKYVCRIKRNRSRVCARGSEIGQEHVQEQAVLVESVRGSEQD